MGGGNSAWATDVPYSIGSEGCGFLAEYSDPYTVKSGETLHLTFTNNNFGTSTVWNNYIIQATDAVDQHTTPYFNLRGDNYAFDAGTFVQNYNGNFTTDLNGAIVENYITYTGGVITVNQIFTKADVTTFNRIYTYTVAGSPASVVIYVTEEAAQVTISEAEISSWATVWTADFSSAPTGMTYSSNGSTDISAGYLNYQQAGGSGDRTINAAFTSDAFNVTTNWEMEFDWNCGSANTNTSYVTFATDKGNAFTLTWAKYAGSVIVTKADGTEISTTLPLLGYKQTTCSSWSHITIKGISDEGIYLTISKNGTTYVYNQQVTSTFGYPSTFNGSLGKTVSSMFIDNIKFSTPAVAGFVAAPTYIITAPDGTNRKFTLDCLTEGTTIYYATSDLEKDAPGWLTYTSEVSTDAATIYAYAKDAENNTSEKISFATGAGVEVKLNEPTFAKTAYSNGAYTVTMSSNQAGLSLVPASTTLYYSIDGGAATVYSGPFSVEAGASVTGYVTATGYTNSDEALLITAVRPALIAEWSIDFAGQAKEDKGGVTVGEKAFSVDGTDFGNISAENYLSNDNFGVKTGSSWLLRNTGSKGLYSFNSGSTPIGIANLKMGRYVKIVVAGMTNCIVSGAASLVDNMSTTTELYIVANEDGNACIDFNRNVYIQSISVCYVMTSIAADLGTNGYATFACDYALDLTKTNMPEGVTAYKAAVDGTKVRFTELDQTVPAFTGILLKGAASAHVFIPVVASGDAVSENAFLVNTAGTTFPAEDGYNYFGLMKDNNPLTFATFDPATVAIPANKAYLKVETSSPVHGLDVTFEGADGIETLKNVDSETMGNAMFDLSGRRVAKAQKGIYIVNGKKVVK